MSFFRAIFNRQLFISIILLGLLVLLAFPLTKNFRQKKAVDLEIKGLEKTAADLEGKNSHLKEVLDYMQSSQFVEEEARQKLNYKKPGEAVAVIEGLPSTTSEVSTPLFDVPPAPPVVGTSQASQNIQKWLDYFFGPK